MPTAMDMLKEPAEEIQGDPVPTVAGISNPLASVLEEQRQEHMQQIQLLQQKLQEQQRINEQQQQQLQQQQQQQQRMPAITGMPVVPGVPVIPGMQPAPQELQPAYETPQQPQLAAEGVAVASTETQGSDVQPPAVGQQQQQQQQQRPKFQLQPEVFAQIQALTGYTYFTTSLI